MAEGRSKRYELLVFDWDGTLIDSAGLIVASLQAACAEAGLEQPSDPEARHVIGLGLGEAIAHLLPSETPDRHKEVTDLYIKHYLAREREETAELFTGTEEALRHLRGQGHTLAVATGKSRRGLDRVLGRMGLAEVFNATRCSDETFSKPHPRMLEELMDVTFTAPEATVMIGDTTHDLEMARNAGVDAVAVTWGAHPPERLRELKPVACLDEPAQLWRWLAEHT